MVRPEIRWLTFLLPVVLSCGGGGGGGAGGRSGDVCAPGASVGCTCTNGKPGAQICTATGAGYGACTCTSVSGSGGTTGSAGTTDVGGSTGRGGTVGTAGAFGTAGTTGASGSTGTGGGSGGTPVNCGSSSSYNGRYVSVTFKDAIIGPGKVDHTSWDVGSAGGTFTIPADVLNALGTALAGGDPVGGSLAVLAGPALNAAIDATAKPDAYGTVSGTAFGVMTDVFDLAQSSEAIKDNYTPVWPRNGFTFQNAPIDCDVRFDVTLIDLDLINDDPIGAPEIN